MYIADPHEQKKRKEKKANRAKRKGKQKGRTKKNEMGTGKMARFKAYLLVRSKMEVFFVIL